MNDSFAGNLFGILILLSIPGAIITIALIVHSFFRDCGEGQIMAMHLERGRYCDECGRRCLGERCMCEGHTHFKVIRKPYRIVR